MTRQRQKKLSPPFPPTLRLDTQHAWRQGEDAIFLPIVYDPPRIKHFDFDADVMVIQVIPPDAQETIINRVVDQLEEITVVPVPLQSAELLSRKEKRKNLASLKRKAETGDFRVPKQAQKDQKDQAEANTPVPAPAPESVPPKPKPAQPKPKHLSNSVPLLLLAVLTLAFFAWMAFR